MVAHAEPEIGAVAGQGEPEEPDEEELEELEELELPPS